MFLYLTYHMCVLVFTRSRTSTQPYIPILMYICIQVYIHVHTYEHRTLCAGFVYSFVLQCLDLF